MLLKILGGIDLVSGLTLLLMVFGIKPFASLVIFCAGLLFLKSLFIFSGEPLSAIDLVSSIILLISLFFTLPAFFLWMPAFLLIAKGTGSFF